MPLHKCTISQTAPVAMAISACLPVLPSHLGTTTRRGAAYNNTRINQLPKWACNDIIIASISCDCIASSLRRCEHHWLGRHPRDVAFSRLYLRFKTPTQHWVSPSVPHQKKSNGRLLSWLSGITRTAPMDTRNDLSRSDRHLKNYAWKMIAIPEIRLPHLPVDGRNMISNSGISNKLETF